MLLPLLCSPDYLKPETIQYNCISTQLKIKYAITRLWIKTNAPEAMFYRAFHHRLRHFLRVITL